MANSNRKRKPLDSEKKKPKKPVPEPLIDSENELVREFYKVQKELLEKFDEDQKTINLPLKVQEDDEREEDRTLAQLCFALNIGSLIGNLAASIISGSLSIMSTFVDSSMDIACSFVMNICLSAISSTDAHKYPRGRDRLELIGVILCSVIMAFANVSMIMQSVNAIVNDTVDPQMTYSTMTIVVVQTLLKGILMGMCYRRGSNSSLVIAMDLSFIDHAMIYYTGQNAQVELHIVLDEKMTLKETHDISHHLEKKIQKLDFVERCFVHVDYSCDGD